jgi:hypothetical protein
MQDIAGCRLVVPNVLVQDQVVERLKSKLAKAAVVDRRKQPSFGYRAVHIIATARNKPIEIQVRTELQHLWAQLSEKRSDVEDPAIKYGGGSSETQKWLSAISSLITEIELRELTPLPAEHGERLLQLKGGFRQYLEEEITKWEGRRKSGGES